MPNIKSAIKRVKVSSVKKMRNRMIKSGLKAALRNYQKVVNAQNIEEARTMLPKVVSTIDKAAAKGVLHKNAANRKKAQVSQKLNALQQA